MGLPAGLPAFVFLPVGRLGMSPSVDAQLDFRVSGERLGVPNSYEKGNHDASSS